MVKRHLQRKESQIERYHFVGTVGVFSMLYPMNNNFVASKLKSSEYVLLCESFCGGMMK